MKEKSQNEIREMRDGAWYWISKALIWHHASKIKARGLAVYNLLAALADRNQTAYPSLDWLAKKLGCSKPTIRKALKLLEEEGLIEIHRQGRKYCFFRLLSLRPGKRNYLLGKDFCQSKENFLPETKNNISKINNTNNIAVINFLNSKASKGGIFVSREEVLAQDLAQALNDRKNLAFYLSLARKYPESFLRQILGEVKEIPLGRMRKGRAALFNYLVKKYGRQSSQNLSS